MVKRLFASAFVAALLTALVVTTPVGAQLSAAAEQALARLLSPSGDLVVLDQKCQALPSLSLTGRSKIVCDSADDTLKSSINGGAFAAIGGGGSGDVTAVGPGCATGACLTNGLATTGGTIFIWEGTTVNANDINFAIAADPGSNVTLTFPTITGTFVTTGDTDTVTSTMILDSTVTTTDIAADTILAGDIATGAVATAEILDDTVGFLDIDYTNTLAGNPALAAEECFWTTDGTTGGGVLCEGTIANTNEQLYAFPAVDGADTTNFIVVDGTQTTDIDGGGLAITAGVLAVGAGNAITVNADDVAVTANSIDDAEVADNSLTAVSLATDSVAADEIATGAVTTTEILDDTVGFLDADQTITLAGDPALATGQAYWSTTGIIFEGATANGIEGLLTAADIATTDKTWTLPDVTGTIVTTGDTGSVTSTMILDNTITATDLAATLTFADGDFVDMSAINGSSTTEGLKLPQATSCTSSTADGQICWDNDNEQIVMGDGTQVRGMASWASATGCPFCMAGCGTTDAYAYAFACEGSLGVQTTEANRVMTLPRPIECNGLSVCAVNGPNVATEDLTFTLRVNETNTALSCTIVGAAAGATVCDGTNSRMSCVDTETTPVVIAAGSRVTLLVDCVGAACPTTSTLHSVAFSCAGKY